MYSMSRHIYDILQSPAFLINVIQTVSRRIGYELSDRQETLAINYIKNTNPRLFNDVPSSSFADIMADAIIDEMHLNRCEEKAIDIREMLKQNLGETVNQPQTNEEKAISDEESVRVNIGSIFGLKDMSMVVKKINEPISSVNNAYFFLDSRYRILENDGTTYFKWGHINSLIRAQGTYNSVGDIRDIISVKIMAYRLPAVSTAITPYKRITIFVQELCPQSFVAHEERRFHAIGEANVDGDWVDVNPRRFDWGEYKFNKPITRLDSMTLTFASPLEPIVFDKDRLLADVGLGAVTTLTFAEPHNILTGSIVYIDNFTTKNPVYDINVINEMNGVNGLVATVITPISITVPVDTSGLVQTLSGTVNSPSVALAGNVQLTSGGKTITGAGTSFTSDFAPGEYIQFFDSVDTILKVLNVVSDTSMETEVYHGASGTYVFRKTTTDVVGVGTLFTSELNPGDLIKIFDGADEPEYFVKSITSDTQLEITQPYNGANGAGFAVEKDNNSDAELSVFFGSKRVFIPVNITYLSADKPQ